MVRRSRRYSRRDACSKSRKGPAGRSLFAESVCHPVWWVVARAVPHSGRETRERRLRRRLFCSSAGSSRVRVGGARQHRLTVGEFPCARVTRVGPVFGPPSVDGELFAELQILAA